ncbi:MAG: hypothetical protein AAGE59_25490, partial [Cyanobacteria bacterium P01_F01_bin.86]
MVSRLWNFLNIDLGTIAAPDATNSSMHDADAVIRLAEILAVEGPDIQKLAPLIANLDSLLDALNSPLQQIEAAVLPFIPIGTALLQLYVKHKRQKPTVAQRVLLISQVAYLDAVKVLLAEPQFAKWLSQVGDRPASNAVRQKVQRLATIELREIEAQKTLRYFQKTKLAAAYSEVLIARLSELGLEPRQAGQIAIQLTKQAHTLMLSTLTNQSDRSKRSAKQSHPTNTQQTNAVVPPQPPATIFPKPASAQPPPPDAVNSQPPPPSKQSVSGVTQSSSPKIAQSSPAATVPSSAVILEKPDPEAVELAPSEIISPTLSKAIDPPLTEVTEAFLPEVIELSLSDVAENLSPRNDAPAWGGTNESSPTGELEAASAEVLEPLSVEVVEPLPLDGAAPLPEISESPSPETVVQLSEEGDAAWDSSDVIEPSLPETIEQLLSEVGERSEVVPPPSP